MSSILEDRSEYNLHDAVWPGNPTNAPNVPECAFAQSGADSRSCNGLHGRTALFHTNSALRRRDCRIL
ncbi:hypothetical protein MPLA_930002 [Mesorhizobium sp. ORS 3359]|nr:hypothetical protein MPLA_930002 [Mesorhizobium sp. ORS 3359]